ncbi:MAG: hypothetical protein JW809_06230 [Pirellulales bacterium]|nr:hypothetical protein [Pirellulales bacterium]
MARARYGVNAGLVHLNGNLLASIDLETTGLQAGHHEPIQIAVVPLNSGIRPLEGARRARIQKEPAISNGRKRRCISAQRDYNGRPSLRL